MLSVFLSASAQTTPVIPASITTPDKVESRFGSLDFKDGVPAADTAAKLYDNLDFTHAFDAFVNTMSGVSIAALNKGLQSVGVKDNEVIVFSELMDARSLYLTANADTIYVSACSTSAKARWWWRCRPSFSGPSMINGSAG
jgi:hypothetical protein